MRPINTYARSLEIQFGDASVPLKGTCATQTSGAGQIVVLP